MGKSTVTSTEEGGVVKRNPDFVIGNPEAPYLLRWFLIPKNRFFNIYLHCFLRSDNDVPHDHPWGSLSIALKGVAEEERLVSPRHRRYRRISAGTILYRQATYRHRMIIGEPFWTLFLTGPITREWGFWCDRGSRFVPWQRYTPPEDKGQVGRGCD